MTALPDPLTPVQMIVAIVMALVCIGAPVVVMCAVIAGSARWHNQFENREETTELLQ